MIKLTGQIAVSTVTVLLFKNYLFIAQILFLYLKYVIFKIWQSLHFWIPANIKQCNKAGAYFT